MIEQVKIDLVKSNPNNPRIIKDDKFELHMVGIQIENKRLCWSLIDQQEMPSIQQ